MKRRETVDELIAQAHEVKRIDYDKLRELAEQAFELACQLDTEGEQYTYGMASALSMLAYRNSSIGEWDAASSEAAQALALLEPGLPTPVLAEVLQSIGWTHYCIGEYTEALENLMEAARVAEEIGDRSLQAYMLDSIGAVQASANHSDAAAECQQRALEIHRELGDITGEALVLNNMAYTYVELGEREKATRRRARRAGLRERGQPGVLPRSGARYRRLRALPDGASRRGRDRTPGGRSRWRANWSRRPTRPPT